PAPQLAHLLPIGRQCVGAVEEIADRTADKSPRVRIPADQARPRERLALPRIRPLAVVAADSVEARREATALRARAQTEVERESHAGRRDVTERGRERLDSPVVEDVGVHGLRAVGHPRILARSGDAVAEDDEEVEVRAGGELSPAELADADDGGVD